MNIRDKQSVAVAPKERAVRIKGECVRSDELLLAMKPLTIVHQGEQYSLRITANGKLLLTK